MDKTRIAILGGGPAALAAAWEITESPNWNDRFEVDVYTMGWRLGGKCASSRNPDKRWRNEEHGLHVLGGFYHNTFQQLRPLYAAWAQVCPDTSIPFTSAFRRHQGFAIAQAIGAHRWSHVTVNMPSMPGEPGVNPSELSVWALLRRVWAWIAAGLDRVGKELSLLDWNSDLKIPGHGDTPLLTPELRERAQQLRVSALQLAGTSDLEAAITVEAALARSEALLAFAADLPEITNADWRGVLNFLGAVSKGIVRDRVFEHGFDSINHLEAEEWLRQHGGKDHGVACPLFQASYHYAFAYIDGDPHRKNIAAGSGLRGLLRMLFTYHGTIFQHMDGGMGEVFVVPYYEVLKKRGVRFHFFHRVENIEVKDGLVTRIDCRVQAECTAGSAGYEPLIDVQDASGKAMRRCWPTAPLMSQLKDAEAVEGVDLESWFATTGLGTRKSLAVGSDFHHCVLAISGGVLPRVAGTLAADNRNWQTMLQSLFTTPTVSAQLWRHDDAANYGGMSQAGMLTGYALAHSTWADVSFQHALETDHQTQASISILCGPAPKTNVPQNSHAPQSENERAEKITKDWLDQHVGEALPALSGRNGRYDPTHEYDRYTRMNSDPTSLYMLTPKGTVEARIRCEKTGYRNLLVAGDWTRHNLDMGAVEAAVMSGRRCARALCGHPQAIYGEQD